MIRPLQILMATMMVLLSAGLAGAFALGFGAPVPVIAVEAAIVGGTMAMVAVFAVLITAHLRVPRG